MIERDDTERLHVLVGAHCNNNCVFCMEDERDWRAARNESISPEDVRHLLVQHRERGEVMFTSGEPTLNPSLLRYFVWARRLGYRMRGVITNGRRFADPRYAIAACKAGLNHVVVSIHGGNPRLHDSLTRTPGAFVQTAAGIRNLGRLKARFDLALHTSTVVQKRNHKAEHLLELYELLSPDVDYFVLNVIQPWGRGDIHFERLVPRYREVVAEITRFLELADLGRGPRVHLLDLPYCASEGLPDEIRGYMERFVHHETNEGSQQAWYDPDRPRTDRRGGAPLVEEKIEVASSYVKEERFAGLTRELQNQVTRTKRDECGSCVHDPICEGAWKSYVRHYGWEELVPVSAGSPDRPEDGPEA